MKESRNDTNQLQRQLGRPINLGKIILEVAMLEERRNEPRCRHIRIKIVPFKSKNIGML